MATKKVIKTNPKKDQRYSWFKLQDWEKELKNAQKVFEVAIKKMTTSKRIGTVFIFQLPAGIGWKKTISFISSEDEMKVKLKIEDYRGLEDVVEEVNLGYVFKKKEREKIEEIVEKLESQKKYDYKEKFVK